MTKQFRASVFSLCALFLTACSTSPVIESDGQSYKVMEGYLEQFQKEIHWKKSDTTPYTYISTEVSGRDVTYDPTSKISSIHAVAKRSGDSLLTEIRFSRGCITSYSDFDDYDNKCQPKGQKLKYTAKLENIDDILNVDYSSHYESQDGIVMFEWEEFSIPLPEAVLVALKLQKTQTDNKFIGDPITVQFHQESREVQEFKILPSEILAAISGIESSSICDPEYEKLTTRYMYLCPVILP